MRQARWTDEEARRNSGLIPLSAEVRHRRQLRSFYIFVTLTAKRFESLSMASIFRLVNAFYEVVFNRSIHPHVSYGSDYGLFPYFYDAVTVAGEILHEAPGDLSNIIFREIHRQITLTNRQLFSRLF